MHGRPSLSDGKDRLFRKVVSIRGERGEEEEEEGEKEEVGIMRASMMGS